MNEVGKKVGEIFVALKLNKQEFQQSVMKIPADVNEASRKITASMNKVPAEVNNAGNKISASLGKIGKMCAAAFSVAAVTSFVKTVTKSAAEVQAANSQFEQTFGSLADSASEAMEKVAEESGIVKTRLQGVGTSIFAFAKTTGMDSASALNMMQEALQVTADSAAYYDRSLEETSESLKAFLKGNYANDAALGLSCTETTRNTAANKLYGKSFKELSEAQKQLTLLQMVKDANAASGALGQAARESDGLENVLGNLKETWNQFLAVVGKPVLKVAVVVIQNITKALAKMVEVARSAVGEMGKLFGWNTQEAQSGAQTAQAISNSISESVDNEEELTQATKKTNEEVRRGVASFDRLNIISSSKADEAGEDTGGTSGASAPVTMAQTAADAADKIESGFTNRFADLYEKSGFKNFVDNLQRCINKVNWNAIGENCRSIFNRLKPIGETAFKNIQKVGASALGALGSHFGALVTIGGKSFQTLTGGVDKWLSRDQGKIIGFINTIGNNLTRGFDNLSSFWDGVGDVVGGSIDRMRPFMEESITTLLSGVTDLAGSIGEVLSGAFAIGTEALSDWIHNDGAEIGLFFDNLQRIVGDVFTFIGKVFSDIGTTLSSWWNGEGSGIFRNICDMFLNIGTTLMNVWNKWLMPVWDFIVDAATNAWNSCLQPIFEKALSFMGKVADMVATVWNNFLSPVVNWIVDKAAPRLLNALTAIERVFQTVFETIGSCISGLFRALGGLADFISGVFSGNWQKAWQGIKDIFGGIWDSMWAIVRGVGNLIIDGINLLWTGIYNAVSGIVNSLGGIAGAVGDLFGQDWHFSMPAEPPLIPRLAHGGIATAPTLALVGDNAGASTGDPEVIAPLSKLNGMIGQAGGYDTTLLTQILDYMKKIYEMFILMRREGGATYRFIAELEGNVLFDEFVDRVRLYKMRYGTLPF